MELGAVVHIKDSFFDLVEDDTLMSNYENGGYRPHFLCIKDADDTSLLWAIPISSRVGKYRPILQKKLARFGRCDTIVIDELCGKDCAYLIQNAFPLKEEYIDHAHTVGGIEVVIGPTLQKEIEMKLRRCISINRRTGGMLFANIARIKDKLK